MRDCNNCIFDCHVDIMQIIRHDLRQSLTFLPVNYSADVYKCICHLQLVRSAKKHFTNRKEYLVLQ